VLDGFCGGGGGGGAGAPPACVCGAGAPPGSVCGGGGGAGGGAPSGSVGVGGGGGAGAPPGSVCGGGGGAVPGEGVVIGGGGGGDGVCFFVMSVSFFLTPDGTSPCSESEVFPVTMYQKSIYTFNTHETIFEDFDKGSAGNFEITIYQTTKNLHPWVHFQTFWLFLVQIVHCSWFVNYHLKKEQNILQNERRHHDISWKKVICTSSYNLENKQIEGAHFKPKYSPTSTKNTISFD